MYNDRQHIEQLINKLRDPATYRVFVKEDATWWNQLRGRSFIWMIMIQDDNYASSAAARDEGGNVFRSTVIYDPYDIWYGQYATQGRSASRELACLEGNAALQSIIDDLKKGLGENSEWSPC